MTEAAMKLPPSNEQPTTPESSKANAGTEEAKELTAENLGAKILAWQEELRAIADPKERATRSTAIMAETQDLKMAINKSPKAISLERQLLVFQEGTLLFYNPNAKKELEKSRKDDLSGKIVQLRRDIASPASKEKPEKTSAELLKEMLTDIAEQIKKYKDGVLPKNGASTLLRRCLRLYVEPYLKAQPIDPNQEVAPILNTFTIKVKPRWYSQPVEVKFFIDPNLQLTPADQFGQELLAGV